MEKTLEQLKKIIESGILNDLMRAEEAISVFKTIAKNSFEINKSELYLKSSLAYLQLLSFNDLILSINRLYDKSSKRNQTRCIESAIYLLKKNQNALPPIIEKYNTIETLRFYKVPEYIIKLVENRSSSEFAYKLGIYLENKLVNLRTQLAMIKTKRDKTLAHNEHVSVIAIKLDDTLPFLEFGWEILIILGWAFFSTIYGTINDIHLRRDAHMKGFHVNILIQNILKQSSA